ncbi:hypothetical protein HQ308_14755 [Rhodococcus sp. BP-241]|uniref:hypothetical protein n=1 Tax=Rhodococcus sp. BP-241 TaxID=2739441 RepID=UPI001C9B12DD|nr:hypothetical protein [Rhodococcus sp. BP-241]MBY6708063.1 hypothetical protein [Rhodococcus sp. BP-241]
MKRTITTSVAIVLSLAGCSSQSNDAVPAATTPPTTTVAATTTAAEPMTNSTIDSYQRIVTAQFEPCDMTKGGAAALFSSACASAIPDIGATLADVQDGLGASYPKTSAALQETQVKLAGWLGCMGSQPNSPQRQSCTGKVLTPASMDEFAFAWYAENR